MSGKVYCGDCREVLQAFEANSIDSMVTDPPYNLKFMGKKWDSKGTPQEFQEWTQEWAEKALCVLRPGAWIAVFGGTKTYHRTACGIEDAGFEVKDQLQWLYGQGFPKNYDISKGFDKQAGAEREVVGKKRLTGNALTPTKEKGGTYVTGAPNSEPGEIDITTPTTDLAKEWEGWGTALKPAHEPLVLAQKPREGTYCNNVERWGCGGINIDGCRVGIEEEDLQKMKGRSGSSKSAYFGANKHNGWEPSQGRWPANVILDEEAGKMLDEQTGELKSGKMQSGVANNSYWDNRGFDNKETYGDKGGASRFFYTAKASKSERTCNGQIENNHPTVKPISLIRYLVRLITPPEGVCLDPFIGSGTTAIACIEEGVEYVGIEKEEEHAKLARRRIEAHASPL